MPGQVRSISNTDKYYTDMVEYPHAQNPVSPPIPTEGRGGALYHSDEVAYSLVQLRIEDL